MSQDWILPISHDILGLIIGVIFIAPTIYFIRTKNWDSAEWPCFFVKLPLHYMLFRVLATGGSAVF